MTENQKRNVVSVLMRAKIDEPIYLNQFLKHESDFIIEKIKNQKHENSKRNGFEFELNKAHTIAYKVLYPFD